MARQSKTKSTGIHVEGMYTLLRTVNQMGKDASEHLREASTGIAEDFLRYVRGNARSPRAKAAAAVIRVYRDRIPKVGFAAGKRVAVSGRPTIGEFFYGVEFGGRRSPRTQQFPPRSKGFWFYPTLRHRGKDLAEDWFDVIDDAMTRTWSKGASQAKAGSN